MAPEQTQVTASLEPIAPAKFGYDQARHLLSRAGFGGSPEQIRTLADWGPAKSVDHLLDLPNSPGAYPWPKADQFETDIMRPPTEEERRMYREAARAQNEDVLAQLRLKRQDAQRRDRQQVRQMQRWWLTRMIETPRPLEEKLTLFWHGHFATSYRTIENSYHQFLQNQTFRAHAAGNFGEMLFAIIRDPAMLAYLNNNQNRKGRPNENLAREIMELFSLGVGHYTEQDIKEGARALTGYTFEHNDFTFSKGQHDEGAKRILGQAGNMDGDEFVKAILAQRQCSRYIAGKLYRFFVNDLNDASKPVGDAAERVIDDLGATLLASRYELKPMLRRMFLSQHFFAAPNVASQIKSPAELVVGAVRSLRTPVRDLGILNDAMDLMGQNLFFPPNVAGWAGGRSWINTSTLFVRQNILNFLLTGKTPSGYDPLASVEKYDPQILLADLAKSDPGADKNPGKVADYLARFCLGADLRTDQKRILGEFMQTNGGRVTTDSVLGLLALITTMPEFQLT
ncbi:MAG: DUF1800 domain-containing protein [Phycisphaerales bacterium]|nr:DUF1800 domain-containing protein [Phycisphaerales bacterium]